jgi:hypothetical protein
MRAECDSPTFAQGFKVGSDRRSTEEQSNRRNRYNGKK